VLSAFSELTMTLIAATVRHAIALKPKEGQRMIALFKHMLPKDMKALSESVVSLESRGLIGGRADGRKQAGYENWRIEQIFQMAAEAVAPT
jgi:hypothetical protein